MNYDLLSDRNFDYLIYNLSKAHSESLSKEGSFDRSIIVPNEEDTEEKGVVYLLCSNINTVLIENQKKNYYPFLTFKLYNMVAKLEYQQGIGINSVYRSSVSSSGNGLNNYGRINKILSAELNTLTKVLSYNHIADTWEPLIEKFIIKMKFLKENTEKISRTSYQITFPLQDHNLHQSVNINLSDLNVRYIIMV